MFVLLKNIYFVLDKFFMLDIDQKIPLTCMGGITGYAPVS